MVSNDATEDAIDTTVPMHTKVIANQEHLHSLVSDQLLPPDDDDHHFFLTPKLISLQSSRYSQFNDFLSFCIDGAKGNKGPNQTASLKHHFQSVRRSVSWAMYRRQWVLVALDKGAYSKGYRSKQYGLAIPTLGLSWTISREKS